MREYRTVIREISKIVAYIDKVHLRNHDFNRRMKNWTYSGYKMHHNMRKYFPI